VGERSDRAVRVLQLQGECRLLKCAVCECPCPGSCVTSLGPRGDNGLTLVTCSFFVDAGRARAWEGWSLYLQDFDGSVVVELRCPEHHA
jgi:hypothetical protein